MITKALYSRVFQTPIAAGANQLTILSARASASMALRVLAYAAERRNQLAVDLTIGMGSEDGISRAEHQALLSVENEPPRGGGLATRYVLPPSSSSGNIYVWSMDGEPMWAWAGSAHFTQTDFGVGWRGAVRENVLVPVPPHEALAEVHRIIANSIPASDPALFDAYDALEAEPSESHARATRTCILPLVIQRGPRKGNVHASAGLNWGQRAGREPNQAYLPIPKSVAESSFFPPRGVIFRLRTDDGHEFLAATAQEHGKALQTPQSNSLLGQYFRDRLRVPFGDRIELSDLLAFGSRFVRIHRFDPVIRSGEPEFVLEYAPEVESAGAIRFEL